MKTAPSGAVFVFVGFFTDALPFLLKAQKAPARCSQNMGTPLKPVGACLQAMAVDQAAKKTAPCGAVRLSHFSVYLRASAQDFSSSL
jgi:hypothetical protein